MKKLIKELKEAKEAKISSWIDEVLIEIEAMENFFKIAEKVKLVVKGKYISGTPTGDEKDIQKFYKLENELNYPQPQKV